MYINERGINRIPRQTRMHSSRMRTARSSSLLGGWCGAWPVPPQLPLGCGHGPDPPQLPPWVCSWTRSPSTSHLGVGLDQIPSTSPFVMGLETPQDQAHPPGARHPPRPGTPLLYTEFLTHASENITLPQTSFADGNNRSF